MVTEPLQAYIDLWKTGTAVIAAADVLVIFDAVYVQEEDFEGTVPRLIALAASLPAVAKGDSIEYPKASGTNYTVQEISDAELGLGFVGLRLEAV